MTFRPWRCAVLSGKGGTGKTVITAALVRALAGRVLAVDADVDAPNLSLALTVTRDVTHPFFGLPGARVRPEACTGCGACVEACRFSALELRGGKAWGDEGRCEGCGVCAFVCPEKAIDLVPRSQGIFFQGSCPEGPFWGAQLRPGGENSGKLVQCLLEHAAQDARDRRIPLVLIDGPPGTSCPAVSTLGGADAALLVAEPTPTGEEDLGRMGELCRLFAIPAAVVANRSDLTPRGTAELRRRTEGFGGTFLGSIPFLPEIPRLIAQRENPLASLGPHIAPLIDFLHSSMARGEEA
ncbi:MAG TPA: ATP-binding protein [Synergistaceae bacterium]|nr:ATP-binding protein [Synergistaceae bacterium]HQH78941.1 ATP-binding protein [Synergistaceae bacterium]